MLRPRRIGYRLGWEDSSRREGEAVNSPTWRVERVFDCGALVLEAVVSRLACNGLKRT
jgi:hypothetical protein